MAQSGTYTSPGFGYADPFKAQRSEPFPLENAGIRAGEIIAWRCWALNEVDLANEDYRLHSAAISNYRWEFDKPAGLQDDQKLEHRMSGTGIHAFKEHGMIEREYTRDLLNSNTYNSMYWVIGTVALWGEVIEHKDGFRAEWGRVNSLDTIGLAPLQWIDPRRAIIRKLREKYGVLTKRHHQFKIGV